MVIHSLYKFFVVASCFLCLQAGTIAAQEQGIPLAVGQVAVDDALCGALGWQNPGREQIKREMLKFMKETNPRKGITGAALQEQMEKYRKAVEPLIDKVALEQAARGIFLAKGYFGFSDELLVAHFSIPSTVAATIKRSIQEAQATVTAEVERRLNDKEYIDDNKLSETVSKAIAGCHDRVKAAVSAQVDSAIKEKILALEKSVQGLRYDGRFVDLNRRMTLYALQKLAAQNRIVQRQPLEIPASLLVMANVDIVNRLLELDQPTQAELSKLFVQYSDYYCDVLKLYHAVKSNNEKDVGSAYIFYYRLLQKQGDAFDEQAIKVLGTKTARLKELRYQYFGPGTLFSKYPAAGSETNEYTIATGQFQQFSGVKRKALAWFMENRNQISTKDTRAC